MNWEEKWKKDTVHLGDCTKYNELDIIPRKQKSTDFFCEIPQTKRGKPPPGQMKNIFFSNENSSRLCAKTYEFKASKDLLMCMPFDFIDGLKDKN